MSSERNPNQRRRSLVQYVENLNSKMDHWGKGISQGIAAGVTKTKKFAIEKVVKVEPTKESNEMIDYLKRLLAIKTTIHSLSDGTITNLYNTKVDETRRSLSLSEALMSIETLSISESQRDLFKQFGEHVMGRKLFKLNTITHEHLVKMEKELMNPIFLFKSKELHKAELLLTEYESIKRDYDFAVHRYNKLIINPKQKQDININKKKEEKMMLKMSQAQCKKQEKLALLQNKREIMIECIENLERKQQMNLVNCFDKFWKSYSIFAQQQAQTITLKDAHDELYMIEKRMDDDLKLSDSGSNSDSVSTSMMRSKLDSMMRSTSLRVAVLNNENEALSKELRYKNPMKLGSGAFATVYKANDLMDNDAYVAIKKICIGDGDNVLYLSSTSDEAENELFIMRRLNGHCNIVQLLDDYYEETVYNDLYLNLVMDYIPDTLLSRCNVYGETGDTIPHDLIKIYSFQLIKAVNYMHILKIAHRDIKPDNLLIDIESHRLKLCDFGCSRQMTDGDEDEDDKLESYVCSRYYRAPELILQSGCYDCKVDLWSIGCVIAEMFLGTLLFEGYNDETEQLDDIIKKLGAPTEDDMDAMNADYGDREEIVDREEEGESWDMLFCAVSEMPHNGMELIAKLLKYAPHKRLSALQCLKWNYYDDLGYEELRLFDWTDVEIEYAKSKGVVLPSV